MNRISFTLIACILILSTMLINVIYKYEKVRRPKNGFPLNHLFSRLTTYFTNHHTYFTDGGSKNTDPTVFPMKVPSHTYIFDLSNQTGASLQRKMKVILDQKFARFRQRVKPPEISTL
jgi:hypothetical protein